MLSSHATADGASRQALWNTLQWIIIVPAATVVIGLAVAVLADRLRPASEKIAKSTIFLPMAISFVGAGTIWQFMYAWRPAGTPQIGLLNGIWTGIGGDPVAWIREHPLNNFALMVVLIWLESGFAMVLLSAAIKNVPAETLESARVDGASERQVFWRIILPQIRPTMVVGGTTTLILVLKVFDVVFVMTGGRDGTNVLAHRFIVEFIRFGQSGHAAAIVVVLTLATVPFLVMNMRHFREQEAIR